MNLMMYFGSPQAEAFLLATIVYAFACNHYGLLLNIEANAMKILLAILVIMAILYVINLLNMSYPMLSWVFVFLIVVWYVSEWRLGTCAGNPLYTRMYGTQATTVPETTPLAY